MTTGECRARDTLCHRQVTVALRYYSRVRLQCRHGQESEIPGSASPAVGQWRNYQHALTVVSVFNVKLLNKRYLSSDLHVGMTGKMTNKKAGMQAQSRVGSSQPRSADRSRPAGRQPGRPAQPGANGDLGPSAAAGGAGGGRCGDSAGSATDRQGSVKDMIERLDKSRRDGNRNVSPTKRPRRGSRSESASSSASSAGLADGRPLTEQTLRSVMRSLTQQIRVDIAAQFESLREEIGRMGVRVTELEQHVERRDNYIEEIQSRLHNRETRVAELEEEVDRISSESRKKDLIFSGPAVPTAPRQHWTEDVTATAVAMLSRCLTSVPATRDDIEESYRVSKGSRIVCRFRGAGKDSVRDRLYENRLRARLSTAGPGGVAASGGGAPGAAAAAVDDVVDSSGAGPPADVGLESAAGAGAAPGAADRPAAAGDRGAATTQLLYAGASPPGGMGGIRPPGRRNHGGYPPRFC